VGGMAEVGDSVFGKAGPSTKPVSSPKDYKGFKIRGPVSPLWPSRFKAFDASPASINFSEVYSALQTKIVEGQENPLALISTAKLYEVQKYCSLTNHMWDGFWFLMNRRAWQALPDDIKAIVAKNVNAAAVKERADTEKLNASVKDDLVGKGLVFNQPDPGPFRDKLRSAGFYAEWKGKYGEQACALLEKAVGKLSQGWGPSWLTWKYPMSASSRGRRRPLADGWSGSIISSAHQLRSRLRFWSWPRSSCCSPAWCRVTCCMRR